MPSELGAPHPPCPSPRASRPIGALVGAAVVLALLPTAPGAADPASHAAVVRCGGIGVVAFADSPQKCPNGQIRLEPTAAGGSGPEGTPVRRRISHNGPPCPMIAKTPDGPVWSEVRACYKSYLATQPDGVAAEAQLAGAAMGQCDRETKRLADAKGDGDGLGSSVAERRQAIRVWAQWLVRSLNKAGDSMQVDIVRAGKSVTVARLNGPLELQQPDGTLSVATAGTVVSPGGQLYVRNGVSFTLGGTLVPAKATIERCVSLE
jgi:hypothetical protein